MSNFNSVRVDSELYENFAMNLDAIERLVSGLDGFCDMELGVLRERDLRKITAIRESLEAFYLSKNLNPEDMF